MRGYVCACDHINSCTQFFGSWDDSCSSFWSFVPRVSMIFNFDLSPARGSILQAVTCLWLHSVSFSDAENECGAFFEERLASCKAFLNPLTHTGVSEKKKKIKESLWPFGNELIPITLSSKTDVRSGQQAEPRRSGFLWLQYFPLSCDTVEAPGKASSHARLVLA